MANPNPNTPANPNDPLRTPTPVIAPSAPATPAPQVPTVPDPARLFRETHDFAERVFQQVAQEYLEFRRKQYHEDNPSLTTIPPRTEHAEQTMSGRIAEQALRLIPKEVRVIPFVHDLLDTLQWTVDINTLTDRERTELHNMTMIFLNGVQGGVRAWYVQWLLQAAYALQTLSHPNYYLAYPWQGMLYKPPEELAAFERAVRAGDAAGIERAIQHVADHLVTVLRDPLHTQPDLAFSGPNGERRKTVFNLKIAAALAIGGYLAAETVHNILHPPKELPPPQSVVTFPQALEEHLVPEDAER